MCCCLQEPLYVHIPARFSRHRVFVPPCICMTCVYFLHHLIHVCMYIVVIFVVFFLISCACICVTLMVFSASACCCKFFASRSLCICICISYCNCLRVASHVVSLAVCLPGLINCVGFYRATRMHSADYPVARCPSVCPSVRHTPVLCHDYTYPDIF